MLKLSAIGLETTHGYIYPALINGYDPERLRTNSLDIVWNIFPTAGSAVDRRRRPHRRLLRPGPGTLPGRLPTRA